MNKDLLKDLKEKYNEKMKEKKINEGHLKVLLKRKEILENSPIVKDYIELIEQIEEMQSSIYNEQDILDSLVREVECNDEIDSNKLYLYVGTFINEGKIPRMVERDCFFGEFDRYVDIETLCLIDNPIEDREVFESSNTVITDGDLYELHDNFIIDSIKEEEDIAVRKVLTRKQKNKQQIML